MQIEDIFLARIPNANLRLLLRMAKTLVRDAPKDETKPLALALTKLVEQIARINAALAHRVRQSNPRLIARELDFDRALDALWITLRVSLEQTAQAFGHDGLDGLSEARKAKLDLDKLRELGATAETIHDQLFAAQGTGFTKFSFAAQAEAMAALLRIIEEDELREGIEAVVSEELVEALFVCQAEYEDLVDTRMRRELGVSEDFRELRKRLRWLLARYKSAVEGLYDEDEPETEALVCDALRALMIVNAHLSRAPVGDADEVLDAELEPEGLLFDEDEDEAEDDDQVESEAEPEPVIEALDG